VRPPWAFLDRGAGPGVAFDAVRNRALAVLVLGLGVARAGSGAEDKARVNTIKKVSVKGGTVEIVGTQKPSFTTFPMSDPPRFVIDISEAVFSGVPEDVPVPGGGRITAIRTASYGNDASAIARVVIGFDRDVEPDVQATGNTLMVKVGSGSAPAVASRAAPAAAAAATTSVGSSKADTSAMDQARAMANQALPSKVDRSAEEQAARDALAKAQAAKAAEEEKARAAALAEQQRQQEVARQREAIAAAEVQRKEKEQAEQQARARAEQERIAQDKARAEAQARAEADRRAQEEAARAAEAQRKAQEQAAQTAAAAEADRRAKEDAARAEARRQEEAGRAEAQRKAQETARAEAQRKAEAETARAEADRKAQEEARRAEEERKAREAASARAVVAQAESQRARPVAASDAPAGSTPSAAQPASAGTEISPRRKTVTLVGFAPDKSRVFVRTNEPVRYTVSQADDRTVVIELENTAFQRSNDRRPLDTRFFGGPVMEIAPRPASGKTVRVAVTLRDKVGYQARQDGNEVSLQFAP